MLSPPNGWFPCWKCRNSWKTGEWTISMCFQIVDFTNLQPGALNKYIDDITIPYYSYHLFTEASPSHVGNHHLTKGGAWDAWGAMQWLLLPSLLCMVLWWSWIRLHLWWWYPDIMICLQDPSSRSNKYRMISSYELGQHLRVWDALTRSSSARGHNLIRCDPPYSCPHSWEEFLSFIRRIGELILVSQIRPWGKKWSIHSTIFYAILINPSII